MVYMTGLFTSLLLECHIAVAFMLSVYRCAAQLERLHYCIFFVWPLGIFLGCLDTRFQNLVFDQKVRGCVTQVGTDLIFACSASLCTCVCLCCYFASTRKVFGD